MQTVGMVTPQHILFGKNIVFRSFLLFFSIALLIYISNNKYTFLILYVRLKFEKSKMKISSYTVKRPPKKNRKRQIQLQNTHERWKKILKE